MITKKDTTMGGEMLAYTRGYKRANEYIKNGQVDRYKYHVNPYKINSKSWLQWIKGWRSAILNS